MKLGRLSAKIMYGTSVFKRLFSMMVSEYILNCESANIRRRP